MTLKKFEFAEQVLGFIISERINQENLQTIHDNINEALQKYDSISLYVEDTTTAGVDFKIISKDFTFRLQNNSQYSRIAIVSDKAVLAIYTRFKALFMKAEMMHFPLKNRMEALNWVSAIYTSS